MENKTRAKAAIQLLDAAKRRVERALEHLTKSNVSDETGDMAMSAFNRIERCKIMLKEEYKL